MNQGHKEILEKAIADYRVHDASAALAAAFPEYTDLSVAILDPMTGEQFAMFSDRVIDNFEEVLKTGLWSAFPSRIQNPTLNIADLAQYTAQFVALLRANDCTNGHQALNKLIKVQLDLGIWNLADKSKTPTRSEIKNIAARMAVQVKRIEAAQDTLNALLESGESERKGLNAFTAEKKKEFDEIRRMVAEAKQNLDQLASLFADGQKKNTAITEIESRAKQVTEDLNVQLGVIKKTHEDYQKSSSELIEQQSERSIESKRVMDEAEKLYKFIKGKEEEIIRLLGMAADASLGTKYNDRGEKIGRGLRFWQMAVPASVVMAVIWVIVVFTCLKTTEFNEWVDLGINLLKTSPAFILMGFVFTQYSKERNLQEEWLFKAAVAMTINTYADLLEDRDTDANKSRQQLILNALKQVHAPPHLYAEKGGSIFSLKAKELRSTLETLNETIQSLKPKP